MQPLSEAAIKIIHTTARILGVFSQLRTSTIILDIIYCVSVSKSFQKERVIQLMVFQVEIPTVNTVEKR